MNAQLKELPPARILDCSVEEYRADPCAVPSLSASTAHKIVSESPLHAWTDHLRFKATNIDELMEAEDDDTKAKLNGQLVHRLLLGKGADVAVIEADNFRTKAAREERDEAKAAGKLPILAGRFDELIAIIGVLRERCRALGYEFTGESEMAIEWYEQGAAGPVVCRSMLDHVFIDDGVIFDVKTIRSANPDRIARTFVEHGYHLQDYCYMRALERLRPKLAGRVDMTFLFMEIEAPFAIVPVVPDGAIQEIGKQHWGRALSLWERCLAKNDWPSYCTSRITIEAPQYVIAKHLGKEWAE